VSSTPPELRCELWVGATRAGFIQYRSEPGTILLVHTEVDPTFEGRGLGARFVASTLDDLRARGLTLVALCPFVRAYLRHHREYADLLARGSAAQSDHAMCAKRQPQGPTRPRLVTVFTTWVAAATMLHRYLIL
jgi:predicted GNAT family acetyltransferase